MVPKGNDNGTRQRRTVDDRLGLQALGIGQSIGQDQAPLSVRIDDFDGLALTGLDDIARLHGTAVEEVLGRRHDSDQI